MKYPLEELKELMDAGVYMKIVTKSMRHDGTFVVEGGISKIIEIVDDEEGKDVYFEVKDGEGFDETLWATDIYEIDM